MSVSLLVVCHMVPAALVSMLSGTLIDRLNKKMVMLAADSLAAMMSLTVLVLSLLGVLRVEHLYSVNVVLGVCDAFQSPAALVVTSALVPSKHYLRVSGLRSFSGSLKGILVPALATAVLALGGLNWVLTIDLITFSAAFLSLCLLRVPRCGESPKAESFGLAFRKGFWFLRGHTGVFRLIGYQMLLNLIAGVGYFSILTPMVLLRTGGNELILGLVNGCVGIGAMAGALWVTARPCRGRMVPTMCISFMLSFALCDFLLGVGRRPWVWCIGAFLGNLPLPVGDGCLDTLYRSNVPIQMQGRVFATRDALVRMVVVCGYFAGAILADHVAEPLLALRNPLSNALRMLVGEGDGRAMGSIFLATAVIGLISSLAVWRDSAVKALEHWQADR